MYDISEIRRENMRALAQMVGGITALADKLNKSQSQISQLIGKSPTKNVGNRIARQVEKVFDKPVGWMDILHNRVEETITAYELIRNTAPHRPVPLFNLNGQTHDINSIATLQELSQCKNYELLIPANPRLGPKTFALRLADIDTQKCGLFTLPAHAILVVDPDQPVYHDAYILMRNHHTPHLTLRQISMEGKKVLLKSPGMNYMEEPLATDTPFVVVRQIMVDLD